MGVKYTNNATTTFTGSVASGDTTISVVDASIFPTVGGADYAYLTLVGLGTLEIVKVTSISGNDLTCVRAQDNTTAQSFTAGEKCELRVTTAMLQDALQEAYDLAAASEAAAAASAAAALVSEGLADADATQTALDVIATAADAIATAADVVATEAAKVAAQAAQVAAEAAVNGIYWKEPVVCVAATNITLSGEQTIDGILTSTSRVLVTGQTVASENGIYISDASAWSRAAPMDTWDEHVGAAVNAIAGGTTYALSEWLCSVSPGGTLDTTDITWNQRPSGDMKKADNLAGLADLPTARTNLGLGSLATLSSVDTAQLTADAVDGTKLADTAVNTEHLTDDSVTPAKAVPNTTDETTTTRTFGLADNLETITFSNASAATGTIPANATTAFTADATRIDVGSLGAGGLTITAASGVTLNGVTTGSFTLTQYQGAAILKVGTDAWWAPGQTVA